MEQQETLTPAATAWGRIRANSAWGRIEDQKMESPNTQPAAPARVMGWVEAAYGHQVSSLEA